MQYTSTCSPPTLVQRNPKVNAAIKKKKTEKEEKIERKRKVPTTKTKK